MTEDLGLFRQRLRRHYFELRERMEKVERGTPLWWAYDKAMRMTNLLHLEEFREPIIPVHSAGEGPESRTPPA